MAIAVGVLAVLGAVFFATRSIYEAGYRNGSERIQVAWDANKADIQRVTDAAIADANKRTTDALEANQVIHENYEQRLTMVSSNAADFARRMRDAEARLAASSRAMSTDPGKSGPVEAGGQISSSVLTEAIAADDAEREANYDRLDALVAQINRQMLSAHP